MKQPPVTNWPSPLDLRLLLVLLIAVLVVSQWRPHFWSAPSSAVAQFALWLQPLDRSPPKVALMRVEKPEAALWGEGETDQSDNPLARALQKLHEQNKVIGIVLRHPIDRFDLDTRQLQSLLNSSEANLADQLQKQLEQRQQTRGLLESDRVVLGLSAGRTQAPPAVDMDLGTLQTTLPFLRNWLWPIASIEHLARFPDAEMDYYPTLTLASPEQSLVYQEGDAAFPSFALQLLRQLELSQANAGSEARPLVWQRDRGMVGTGRDLLPLSAKGSLVPLVNQYSTMAPSYARLSLSAALSRPVPNDVILIGGADDPLLASLAANLVATVEGLTLVEPHWFSPLNKSLLLILLPVVLLLFPRLNNLGGVLLWSGLSVGLLTSQFFAHTLYGVWLPVADLLWALTAGWLIMMLWQRHQRQQAQHEVIPEQNGMDTLGQAHQALTGFASPASPASPPPNLAARTLPQPPLDRGGATGGAASASAAQAPSAAVVSLQGGAAATGNLATTLVMELEGPMLLGRYEIQREVGRGAMGTVYLAYDPKIARQVAIKTLNFKHIEEPQLADIKQRFYREAAAAGRLNHPQIVSVFDVGEEQELAYIAMDYVEGDPLSKYVTPSQLLSPFEVYRITAAVARALHYAHEHNVIHRDVKPANIMYSVDSQQLKVTDFGIARLVDDSRTSTGEILGSPLYIAPEQLQGKELTPRVDVYSLGVTFYQLLTGELPFAGDSLASLTYNIIHGSPRSVRKLRHDLPSSASRIVNRALQKDVSKRYQSALEMAEALEKAMRRDYPRQAKAAGLGN